MQKFIRIEGVDIEVVRTKNKNAYLRIYPEKAPRVVARVPRHMPDDVLEGFLRGRIGWVQKHLAAIEAQQKNRPPEEAGFSLVLRTGGEIMLWGKKCVLVFADSAEKYALQHKDKLLLFGVQPENRDAQKLLEGHIATELEQKTAYYMALYCSRLRVREPVWHFRKMRSRWGSCQPAKRSVTINSHLWRFPEECLGYVVAHELCHLRVPNHGKDFYALLEQHCPQWKAIRKYMKTLILPG